MGNGDKRQILAESNKMLKAEIDGIGIPEKGTPQGGILSPLLANVVLNELDWWISSQWAEYKSHHQYSNSHKYRALKTSKLKEMYIVRYADDFKIFCRKYNDARKVFIAVKDWLETRLELEVSPEKSKITNLKKNYSEFLGIKLKVQKKRKIVVKKQLVHRYVLRSSIADKAKERILQKVKALVKRLQRSSGSEMYANIDNYNAYVIGVHNYYNIATCCCDDFCEIAFLSLKLCHNRLNLRKRKPGEKIPRYMQNRYGNSKCLRFICNRPLLPISYVKLQMHPAFNGLSPYIEAHRQTIHNRQKSVSQELLRKLLMRSATKKSVEFNDNRIALFVAQYGKCAVTGIRLNIDEINCHHKKPSALGGGDEYANLTIVHRDVHHLIHASKTGTINRYLKLLNLNEKMIEKVNSLRKQAQQDPIL